MTPKTEPFTHFAICILPFTFWNLNFGPSAGGWNLDLGPSADGWNLDFGSWILDFGSWILEFGSWNLHFALRIADCREVYRTVAGVICFHRLSMTHGRIGFCNTYQSIFLHLSISPTQHPVLTIADCGFRIEYPDYMPGTWHLGTETLNTLHLGFQIFELGSWILDFGSWILYFGFWNLHFALRIADCREIYRTVAGFICFDRLSMTHGRIGFCNTYQFIFLHLSTSPSLQLFITSTC